MLSLSSFTPEVEGESFHSSIIGLSSYHRVSRHGLSVALEVQRTLRSSGPTRHVTLLQPVLSVNQVDSLFQYKPVNVPCKAKSVPLD